MRRRVLVSISLLVTMLAGLVVMRPMSATTLDPAAAEVVQGLLSMSKAVAATSSFPSVSTDLPLTETSVRDLLSLDTALGLAINRRVTGKNPTLATFDDIFDTGALVMVERPPAPGSPADTREWDATVRLDAASAVALALDDGRIRFGAGEIDGELVASLDATMRLRYDPTQLALRRFSIVGNSPLALHVWSRPSGSSSSSGRSVPVQTFTVIDGFVELEASGTALVDTTTTIRMRDPNGRGFLTTEDLQLGTPEELLVLQGSNPAVGDRLAIDLDLRAPIVDGTVRGHIRADGWGADTQHPFADPVVTRDATLGRLTALTRAQAIGSYAQFVSAMRSVESDVDANLPMLDATLTDVFSPATVLEGIITEQAAATIVCGAAPTSPPTGAPRPGRLRYCQAITNGISVDTSRPITWTSTDPGVRIDRSGPWAVGTAPTGNVEVRGGGGFPRLRVAFTDTNGIEHRAASTLLSIQQLAAAVRDGGLGGVLAYRDATHSLEIAMNQSQRDRLGYAVRTGGTPSLAQVAGLAGLCQALPDISPRRCPRTGDGPDAEAEVPPSGAATLDARNRRFDATFGVGLLPEADAPEEGDPAPASPVAYVTPGAAGLLWQIGSLSAHLPGDAPLVARIGFLQVDVDVQDYSLTSGDDPAATVTLPVGTVDLGDAEVADSVPVLQLFDGEDALSSTVTPIVSRPLEAAATLRVRDTPTTGTTRLLNADATLEVQWSSLSPGALPEVAASGDYARLRALDLVPSRRGTAGVGSAGARLIDPTADFLTQLGVTQGASETDRTFHRPFTDVDADNLTTPVVAASTTKQSFSGPRVASAMVADPGGLCSAFVVIDAHTLECKDGPLTEGVGLVPGHRYVMDGNPGALRDALIESIASVVSTYATPDAQSGFTSTLPLVDLRPDEISGALDALRQLAGGLQAEAAGDTGTAEVSTLQGFARAVSRLGNGTTAELGLTGTGPDLGRLELRLRHTSAPGTTSAPLRIALGTRQLSVLVDGATERTVVSLPLETSSSAEVHLGLDLTDGSALVGSATNVVQTIHGLDADSDVPAGLAGRPAEFGSTAARTGTASGIRVGLGVRVTTQPSGADWFTLDDLRSALRQTRARVGSAQTCADSDVGGAAACARVPLVDGSANALTTIDVSLLAGESSGGSGGPLAAQPVAYRFLADSLAGLSRTLRSALDGDQSGMSLPLVGVDLDGGSDIPKAVEGYAGSARAALIALQIVQTDSGSSLATALHDALAGAVPAGMTVAVGTPRLLCNDAVCGGSATVADVDEVRIATTLGGRTQVKRTPFVAGPAGLDIVSDQEVVSTTSWSVPVTLGIRRDTGPFLLMVPSTGSTVPVLEQHIVTELAEYSNGSCHPWARVALDTSDAGTTATVPQSRASGSRCIDALVGKFPAVLVERTPTTGARNGVETDITVSATPQSNAAADASGRVYLPALYEQKLSTQTTADGSGAIDVYFESFASELGFFDVVGTVEVQWEDGDWSETGARFANLQIDAETVYDIIDVGYGKAAKYLQWFNPVMDFLTYKIPGISYVAELAGQPPVTPLFLLTKGINKKVGTNAGTAFQMVAKILEFQQLLARLPGRGDTAELVGLGSGRGGAFTLPKTKINSNSCSKTAYNKGWGGDTVTEKYEGDGSSGRCSPEVGQVWKNFRKQDGVTDKTVGKNLKSQFRKGTYFSLPNISVPVLENPTAIYGLLYGGGDTDILTIDMGHLGAKATWERYFPLMVGPVPVVATIGAELGIDGRFAFGFDTKGLSDRIADLDRPGAVHALAPMSRGKVFSDGFYIDDLEKGKDVPEVKLTANIYAGASISLALVEAGIRGGVVFDLSIDAFDPNKDGKIYTTEFVGSQVNPDCVFDVSSGIEFYMEFFFFLRLIFFDVEKRWDIARSPRYKIFDFQCSPEDPKLAYREGNDLWLTMGDKVAARDAYPEVVDEKYIVRQMGTDGNGDVIVDVSAFKLVQRFTLPANGKVRVAGGSGADVIRFADGQILGTDVNGNASVTTVPFTLDTVVDGGAGPDQIATEAGDDVITGGAGGDKIESGDGDDVVDAGEGDDAVDGGVGHDVLRGDAGDDRVTGGTGADLLKGGSGADVLQGGSGLPWDQLFPTTDLAMLATMLDTGDLLVGDAGSDDLDGGDGSDLVLGGDFAPVPAFDLPLTVSVFGVDPLSGTIVGVDVPVNTVELPPIAQVRATCDLGGAPSADRDVLTGGNGTDYVLGGAGSDDLSGGGGDDLVCGLSGDDLIAGDGVDVLKQQQGDDELVGGNGDDRLYGDGGVDTLRGGDGADLLRAGDGGDSLDGGSGSDMLLGEDGPDVLAGDRLSGADPATGDDAGGDARELRCSDETSLIGGGIDLNGDLSSNGLDNGMVEGHTVSGGVVLDVDGAPLTGVLGGIAFVQGRGDVDSNGATDSVFDDTTVLPLASIFGAVGEGDCLFGGTGDDSLRGNEGGDVLDGGKGSDTIQGDAGRDFLRGRDGDDSLQGDAGNDLLAGDSGDDLVVGGRGDDVVRGGSGADRLVGGSGLADAVDGRDELLGDGGNDVLAGGNAIIGSQAVAIGDVIPGRPVLLLATPASSVPALEYDDMLYGGFGDDWLFGQDGNDLVRGGADTDMAEGGPGADTVQGDDGTDLVIGGSSTSGSLTSDRSGAGAPDEGDTLLGDGGVDDLDGNDVVVGDNARITVGLDGTRTVQLFDLDVAGIARVRTVAVSGPDRIDGGRGEDVILGQAGDDTIDGGAGDDVIEGGAGRDELHGGLGQDDLLGGGSVNDGLVLVSTTGRIVVRDSGDPGASGLLDDDDRLYGDDGSDVMLGDNGRIMRTPGGESPTRALRTVRMSDTTAGPTSGSDLLDGGAGDDDLYGQLDDTGDGGGQTFNGEAAAGDVLIGGLGDDAIVGDLGQNVPTPAAQLGTPNGVLSLQSGFVREVVRRPGTMVNVTTLVSQAVGGDDVILGGAGNDAVHAGAGNDLANGGDDDDVVFGHLGIDRLWGGSGHDLLFGGAGADLLDLKKRPDDTGLVRQVMSLVDRDGNKATTNDNDVVYGGSGPDILQADSGDNGRGLGDRLIDWTGPFNQYLVCGSGMGAPKVQLSPDPAMQRFLADLALAVGSVGPDELAVPATQETGSSFGTSPGQSICESP